MYLIKLTSLDILPNAVTTPLAFATCPFVPLDPYISIHLHRCYRIGVWREMRELREDRICRQLRWRATSCSGKRVCSGGWGEEQMIEDAVEVGVCFLVCFGCSFHTSHIIIIGQSPALPIVSLHHYHFQPSVIFHCHPIPAYTQFFIIRSRFWYSLLSFGPLIPMYLYWHDILPYTAA
jgi:hypothetical protein